MQASISWISNLKLHIAIIALMTLARRWLCWTEWQIHRFLDIYNLHPQKSSLEPQVKHSDLKAQVLYRLEEFEQCYGVYKDLIKSTDDKYDTERMTNLSAVTANMADKSKMVVDCKDTFEQRYNAGCNHAAVGELGKAEAALKKAEEVAKKFLQEEGEENISIYFSF